MRRLMVLLLGVIAFGDALACSCAYIPLTSEAAREASNVFVFRLLSARANGDPGAESEVTGRIQVLANVRGRTTARDIDFTTQQCCGIRMEVGKDYVGFLSADARHFGANGGNVLALWGRFGETDAGLLEAVLRGHRNVEEAFAYGFQEIKQVRPPPPPCPRKPVSASGR
jgi:hypothetical protein